MQGELKGIGFILGKERPQLVEYKDLYDVVIIGGGPAGLSAAVYTARKQLNTLLISADIGGQSLLTADIANYIGYQYITGRELARKFEEQLKQFPVDLSIGERVEKLAVEHGRFAALTRSKRRATGRSLIICSGKRARPLNVPGEREFTGRGVSYCATCDAPLFAGKEVAVVGGGNSALEAVIDLSKIADSVYVVHRRDSFRADPILVTRIKGTEKITPIFEHQVEEIRGEAQVRGIVIRSLNTQEVRELKVGGVFIEVGLIPNSELARGVVELSDAGEIVVDCACQTSMPGIFAAGDVTTVPEKQIVVAAGEGAKAALSAHKFLLRS